MKTIMTLTALLLIAARIDAQEIKTPQLYWVVETNIQHPNFTIVRFYDQRNVRVHEVKIMGVYIDINIPKHRRKLDELLKDFNERGISTSKKSRPKKWTLS